MKQRLKSLILSLFALAFVLGGFHYAPDIISASTSVNGRELPIYCVDTQKPQIAISFDAA